MSSRDKWGQNEKAREKNTRKKSQNVRPKIKGTRKTSDHVDLYSLRKREVILILYYISFLESRLGSNSVGNYFGSSQLQSYRGPSNAFAEGPQKMTFPCWYIK